jgi:cation diffusion facilitator family transporter
MAQTSVDGAARPHTRRVVFVSLAAAIPQLVALAVAAALTNSSALLSQTFVAAADLGVQIFLAVGVVASTRAADETHPLGYGGERFFWTLFAALAIFVSGCTVAIEEAISTLVNPTPVTAFAVGYVVLIVSIVLDGIPFIAALRETRSRARGKGRTIRQHVRGTTEPATVTELIANGIGVAGGVLALVALVLVDLTGSVVPDAIASALIGAALVAAAIVLTQRNRALLTSRGVHPNVLGRMRAVVADTSGVVDVPDLFAVVVGPSELIVDGDVTLRDELTVPQVEAAIEHAAAALRAGWPEIRYVYLTPVPEGRPRRYSSRRKSVQAQATQ